MIIIRLLGEVSEFSKITDTRAPGRRSEGRWLVLLFPHLAFRSARL